MERGIVIYNNTFEAVDRFKYIGVILTSDNRIQDETNPMQKWGMHESFYHPSGFLDH